MTKAIIPQELFNMLQNGAPVTLIDVREQEEYVEGHIEGSRLIPRVTFLADPILVNPEHPTVFICRSGRRSQEALNAFSAKFPDATAYNLTGGILAWIAASLPIEK